MIHDSSPDEILHKVIPPRLAPSLEGNPSWHDEDRALYLRACHATHAFVELFVPLEFGLQVLLQ
jgi:hypothetical protein